MCWNSTVTHGLGCVHNFTPDLFACSPGANHAPAALSGLLQANKYQYFRAHPVSAACLPVDLQKIAGNTSVSCSDWASSPARSVTKHAGRCWGNRFGGAILLTRSLLRQAASNSARGCAISSKACLCQTVGELCVTILQTVVECNAARKVCSVNRCVHFYESFLSLNVRACEERASRIRTCNVLSKIWLLWE